MNLAKVDKFFQKDSSARTRVMGTCAMAAAIAGLITEQQGLSIGHAELTAAMVGITMFLLQLNLYTVPKNRHLPSGYHPRPERTFVSSPLLLTAAIAILLTTLVPSLQGQILNYRLRRALQIASPVKRQAETKSIIKLATQLRTELRPDLLSIANEVSQRKPGLRSDWNSYLKGVNAELAANEVNIRVESADFNKSKERPLDGDISYSAFNGRVVYNGSKLTAQHLYFADVTIFVTDSENGRRFIEAVKEARGKDVSVSLP